MTTPQADCIIWTGSIDRHGYGKWGKRLAHRIEWEKANGPIPQGMVVMHICDTPACTNVEHLRLGTQADNVADAVAKGRMRWNKATHCANGHEWTPENTGKHSNGSRRCKVCMAAAARRWRDKRKNGLYESGDVP